MAADDGELFEYWGARGVAHPGRAAAAVPLADGARREARVARRRPDRRGAPGLRRGGLRGGRRARPGRRRRARRSARRRRAAWWDWDHGKLALEYLFWTGRITARRRANDFARVYDLPERMLPADGARPRRPRASHDARKALLLLAARSLGVATLRDLADYHRQQRPAMPPARRRAGRGRASCCRCRSRAGTQPAYLAPRRHAARAGRGPRAALAVRLAGLGARRGPSGCSASTTASRSTRPRPSGCTATTCCRSCSATSWSARVDLKAERATSTLLVRGAYTEPGVPDGPVAEALADELALMAGWLGLERVVVEGRGELAPALQAAVGPGPAPGRSRGSLSRPAKPTAARTSPPNRYRIGGDVAGG